MMAVSLTPDEIHTARLMRREGKTIEQIARHLGRSRAIVSNACHGLKRIVQQQVESVTIPASVLAERELRRALQPRDLTAAIAGDPLPGMSALERRRDDSQGDRDVASKDRERHSMTSLATFSRRVHHADRT